YGNYSLSEAWEFLFSKHFKGSPADRLHNLIVVARHSGTNDPKVSKELVDVLLNLGPTLEQHGAARERNWFARLGELHAKLAEQDRDFNQLMLKHANFVRPDHVFFTKTSGFDRKKAAALFLKKVQDDPQFPWNADLIQLLGELPAEEALAVLRQQWGKTGYDSLILPLLAKAPKSEDRPKFVAGLASS